jgi:hypothetical protein
MDNVLRAKRFFGDMIPDVEKALAEPPESADTTPDALDELIDQYKGEKKEAAR